MRGTGLVAFHCIFDVDFDSTVQITKFNLFRFFWNKVWIRPLCTRFLRWMYFDEFTLWPKYDETSNEEFTWIPLSSGINSYRIIIFWSKCTGDECTLSRLGWFTGICKVKRESLGQFFDIMTTREDTYEIDLFDTKVPEKTQVLKDFYISYII